MEGHRQLGGMDTWTEEPRSPTSVSVLSAPPAALMVHDDHAELSSVKNTGSMRDYEHGMSKHTKGYMRDTYSSRAKKRTICPRARKARTNPKGSLPSGVPSLKNGFFVSKIPHAPGVLKRASLDSARISRTAESEFSMTDTAIETLSIREGSSPAMRCSNEAVEEWLDACDAERGGAVPVGEVHTICLTRSESGKTWSVFTEKNLDLVVNVKAAAQELQSMAEGGEGEGAARTKSVAVKEACGGLDVVEEVEIGLDVVEEAESGLGVVEEGESGLDGGDEPENVSDVGMGMSGNDTNMLSDMRVPFSIGHIFTFLLGIGTMTVLGALK